MVTKGIGWPAHVYCEGQKSSGRLLERSLNYFEEMHTFLYQRVATTLSPIKREKTGGGGIGGSYFQFLILCDMKRKQRRFQFDSQTDTDSRRCCAKKKTPSPARRGDTVTTSITHAPMSRSMASWLLSSLQGSNPAHLSQHKKYAQTNKGGIGMLFPLRIKERKP